MSRPVTIISPLLPPLRGGLADHTRRLAEGFSRHHPTGVVSSREAAPLPGVEVRNVISDWHDGGTLEAELLKTPSDGVFIWQYVPHMYGRGGVNFAISSLITRLKAAGRRQIVIGHEIKAPLYWRPHWFFYGVCHRVYWRRIRRAADAIGISTEAWLQRWRADWSDSRAEFFVVPSPSNFPVVEIPPDHSTRWRAGHNLSPDTRVIAYFGTLSAAKQLDWVLEAWRSANRAGMKTALAVIGASPELQLEPELKPLYRPLGYLDEPSVSEALQAVNLLALPFVDGASERRTTITAGLAHGTPILTTIGPSTGTTLRGANFLKAVRSETPSAFAEAATGLLGNASELNRLGIAAREAYRRDYSWDVVIDRLRKHIPD